MMQKMAVLLSGGGTTLDNFHKCIQAGTLNAEIKVVISNVKDVLGLQKAAKYGYPNFHAVGNDRSYLPCRVPEAV
jgi:phosphoribosylglycinamide formyltransferase-1